MIPSTIEERRQLALDLMDHINFFPEAFEKKNAYVLGLLAHAITDPRIHKPIELPRKTRVISAIKKNKALWERIEPFCTVEGFYRTFCKCRHLKDRHVSKTGACKGNIYYGAVCKCPHFRQVTL